MPTDKEKELKDLKDKAQKEKPTEEEKKAKKTIHAEKATVKFGNTVEEVDIITVTDPNAAGGYDTMVHLPFCPISSVTQQ